LFNTLNLGEKIIKQSNKESFSHFMNKLHEKKQNDQHQEQVSDAISIYYEMGATHSGENVTFKNKNTIISTKKGCQVRKFESGQLSGHFY